MCKGCAEGATKAKITLRESGVDEWVPVENCLASLGDPSDQPFSSLDHELLEFGHLHTHGKLSSQGRPRTSKDSDCIVANEFAQPNADQCQFFHGYLGELKF